MYIYNNFVWLMCLQCIEDMRLRAIIVKWIHTLQIAVPMRFCDCGSYIVQYVCKSDSSMYVWMLYLHTRKKHVEWMYHSLIV